MREKDRSNILKSITTLLIRSEQWKKREGFDGKKRPAFDDGDDENEEEEEDDHDQSWIIIAIIMIIMARRVPLLPCFPPLGPKWRKYFKLASASLAPAKVLSLCE